MSVKRRKRSIESRKTGRNACNCRSRWLWTGLDSVKNRRKDAEVAAAGSHEEMGRVIFRNLLVDDLAVSGAGVYVMVYSSCYIHACQSVPPGRMHNPPPGTTVIIAFALRLSISENQDSQSMDVSAFFPGVLAAQDFPGSCLPFFSLTLRDHPPHPECLLKVSRTLLP
ncbi:UNVERIFIED_CONTAM: hypothetical protein PYX00_000920 [Menopon gallinae]|uniref:Uncharacterized protein n=1 Tax=Menopon gallinae TaxID=328185 RepID=A0AAW2IAZ5_9NEOP